MYYLRNYLTDFNKIDINRFVETLGCLKLKFSTLISIVTDRPRYVCRLKKVRKLTLNIFYLTHKVELSK